MSAAGKMWDGAVQWDQLAPGVCAKDNLVSVTVIGVGSWDVLFSYAPRNSTLTTNGTLAKIVVEAGLAFGAAGFAYANATLSGGRVLCRVNTQNGAGVATDLSWFCKIKEMA
jgi:hypothetical protein